VVESGFEDLNNRGYIDVALRMPVVLNLPIDLGIVTDLDSEVIFLAPSTAR